ncbi:MAG: hypothetical protein IJP07_04240, partial [Firmicutes bacterium]|nr:hypothetical protein [Bacillota bacterium]
KGKASDCHCEEVFAAEIYNISQQNDVANLSVSRRSRETFQKGAVATGLPAPGAQTLLFAAFVWGFCKNCHLAKLGFAGANPQLSCLAMTQGESFPCDQKLKFPGSLLFKEGTVYPLRSPLIHMGKPNKNTPCQRHERSEAQ